MRIGRPLSRSATGCLLLGLALPGTAAADCSFLPTAGNDTFVCDSGTSAGGLTDLGGNNTLRFPGGGSGTLDGNVSFGSGDDTVSMSSGEITGAVDLSGGADTFEITAGQVRGNIQQGAGIDRFAMSGGEIASLNQGDNLDDFTMSGGRIVDAFDDGDRATMTGGRIGRVNMKLDNNLFDMSGGTVDRNLVTGFGNDTVVLRDGTIGGNISVSGGTDSLTVLGGTVGGDILASFGDDAFIWEGGGVVYGRVDLGPGADVARLSDLSNAHVGASPAISGGLGDDALLLRNVKTDGVSRFDRWERIDLANDSELVFGNALTLGDEDSGTGVLTVGAGSALFGGGADGAIVPFAATDRVRVASAGRIDLTNAGSSPRDTFRIAGDYAGDNGLLLLDTVLGDDSAPSDRLVIDGGSASGTTGMAILGTGQGDATTRNGILVVEGTNGATSEPGAFALTGRVAAGAYDYFLFRGGVTEGTEDNWYLRSALVTPPGGGEPEPAPAPGPEDPPAAPEPESPEIVAPPPDSELPETPLPTEGNETTPPVDPTPPVEVTDPEPEVPPAPPPAEAPEPPTPLVLPDTPAPVPTPTGPVRPPTPGATPVEAEVVPLYRVEVPLYAAIAPTARYLAITTLGTFHERRGEQDLLRDPGVLPAAWMRGFGQHVDLAWGGTVAPGIEGDLFGFQVGQDILGRVSDAGHADRFGLFVGHAGIGGDVTGEALGWNDVDVGSLDTNGTSVGGYWTHVAPEGWYLDSVLMVTWFDGEASASTGEGVDVDGSAVTASIEGGYPVALTGRWTVEPQGQLVWSGVSIDDQSDSISTVDFDTDDAVTGRLGFRMLGDYRSRDRALVPYFRVNLWHAFAAEDTVTFGTTPIVTDLDATSIEVGGGLVAELADRVSLFASADYTSGLDGDASRAVEGSIGLDIRF